MYYVPFSMEYIDPELPQGTSNGLVRELLGGSVKLVCIVQELCESRGGRWAVRPNEPSGFRGRKDILNHASALVTTCP